MKDSTAPTDPMAKLRELADRVAAALEADVLVFNGPITRTTSDSVIDLCSQRSRKPNVFLMLTTGGGDPHAAYRIARSLQQHYQRMIAYVPGYCKSAGTLLILGAHELVISPHAELGPIDLQVLRSDEVGERSSVLTPTDALRVLQEQAISTFVSAFGNFRAEAQLTTKLSAEMAANLVAGLYHDIFAQIDPIRLGELDRATRIAVEYGERLIAVSKNARDNTLVKLVGGYPSHMFVIDQAETRDLFETVREPSELERQLAIREPISDDKTLVIFVNSERKPEPKPEPKTKAEDASKDGQANEHKNDGRKTSGAGAVQGKSDAPHDRRTRKEQDGGGGVGEKADGESQKRSHPV